MTDNPASLGCEVLQFSAQAQDQPARRTQAAPGQPVHRSRGTGVRLLAR
ncbi:hypothetical protein [Ralstonia pseudosolanacearum]